MFFTITPFADINKQSFRISNHYLSKDDKNNFTSWAWEVSYSKILIDGEFLDESLPKHELRKIYHKIQRRKILTTENRYLNKEGEILLHDIFVKLGSFKFSVYQDDKEPSKKLQFIDINNIKENLLLSFDVTLVVANKNSHLGKNMPLYHREFYKKISKST